MNSLQGVSDTTNYFVSINAADEIAEDKVIKRIAYEHPLFDMAAIDAQKRLPELNRLSTRSDHLFLRQLLPQRLPRGRLRLRGGLCRDLLGKEPW
jgi:hypothetical protein